MVASLLVLALAGSPAGAGYTFGDAEHLEHRDQWGLLAEAGFGLGTRVRKGMAPERLRQPLVDVVLSHGHAITGDEWTGRLRLMVPFAGDPTGVALGGGYRVYAGREHLKTWAALEAWLVIQGAVAIGGRLSVGGTLELGRGLGLFLGFGAHAAGGSALRVGFDFLAGVQWRWP